MEDSTTGGVGALDKAALILGTLEVGPATLAQLVSATGLARPTAHCPAVALEYHHMVARDMQGCPILSSCLQELASPADEDRFFAASMPMFQTLRDHTKESSQFFRRQGDYRVYVAASECEMGLRDSIPVGATLSMATGSAAQVLLTWEESDRLCQGLYGASFNATILSQVRHRDWVQSVGEREPGVASVSVPVRGSSGRVLAVSSISGLTERMGRQPDRQHGPSVVVAANRFSDFLRNAEDSDLQAPLDFKR